MVTKRSKKKKMYRVYFEWVMRGWDDFEADSEEEALDLAANYGSTEPYGAEIIEDLTPVEARMIK